MDCRGDRDLESGPGMMSRLLAEVDGRIQSWRWRRRLEEEADWDETWMCVFDGRSGCGSW